MSRPIALYISSSAISAEQRTQLQHTFDTAQDYPEIAPKPNFIQTVPDADWAIDLEPQDILARHREKHVLHYAAKPIVILDERTARDTSILLVAPFLNEDGVFEFKALRFDPARIPGAAVNISISNQSLPDFEPHVDDDGVWRRFKARGA